MANQEQLIYDLSLEALEIKLAEIQQPAYRAKQIWHGIYQSLISNSHQISTLPKPLRETLDDIFTFQALEPVRVIESRDGRTIKTLFKLRDRHFIEAVLMHYEDRHTLCISSQSGCGIGCSFCATGQMGFKRNLTSGEIIEQVLYYARLLADREQSVTNVVMMGMGEPFQNYENVMDSLNRLNNPEGFGLGARRFTISTVGLIPKIRQFADEGTQYNLAISLHTVNDELRSKLIPINKKYPVKQLVDACRYYVDQTSRRVTFEYALIQGLNDANEDAIALAEMIRGMICHVNLIPLNPTEGYDQNPTSADQVESFRAILESRNIPCTVRVRRGIEIQAGCGQLAAEYQS